MAIPRHKDFDNIVGVMSDLGRQIVSWRSDKDAKILYSKKEFKSAADCRAHDFLINKLAVEFPGVPIISEEDNSHANDRPEKYWLIDPIDGTASWYEGYSGFVTQAAYFENYVPVFGIVHSPITSRMWTAVKGAGARLNGNTLPQLIPNKRLIITDNTPMPHGILKEFMARISATGYIESGSLGLKSALVADGTADLFMKRVVVRDWDIAPVAVILEEVNGCLALPSGQPFIFAGDFKKTEGVIVARDKALLDLAVSLLGKVEANL
jgi:3'(2'), 5'-bisphosphate nucleotidase